jgi:AcrR family transcriptional regulator
MYVSMRPQKVEDQILLSRLFSIIRFKGYDGCSLNDLAEASGLQKASLYHRFPGGKEEIICAVLDFVNEWIKQNIYTLLTNPSISPEERLKRVIKNINNVYHNGEFVCLLGSLSLDSGVEQFAEQIKESMQLWIRGFSKFGVDCGLSKDAAKEKAYQVLINIQGSLIVSKGLGSTVSFKMALKYIENTYQKK